MLNTSNDAVLRKEVLFHCYEIKIQFLTYLFEKFEKITMAPMERKFKNYLNCHNFGSVQDRIVIFGMVFEVSLINGDIYIYPRLTPVATATKFETKLAIARFV